MKYKGRGFPTVDWRGPQGLVFTDGKPEYMDTGTTITPEKMGFAFSPKERWKRPGVSEVTGLPDLPFCVSFFFTFGPLLNAFSKDVFFFVFLILLPLLHVALDSFKEVHAAPLGAESLTLRSNLKSLANPICFFFLDKS